MKRALPLLLISLCMAIFGLTLYRLMEWRFASGDVFPPYSSLRADPLGTMVLYEALERLPGVEVNRDLRNTNTLPDGKDVAYLHISADHARWSAMEPETFRTIEKFIHAGGRLVVTLSTDSSIQTSAQKEKARTKKEEEQEKERHKKAKSGNDTRKDEPAGDEPDILENRWGLVFTRVPKVEGGEKEAILAKNISGLGELPGDLVWHSEVVMELSRASAWKVIYARDMQPVMAERRFGEGSLLVATDTYFLSNEAMQKDRQVELITWMIGPGAVVYFDEAHLGITESPGIAALARKYRLHGAVAVLLVLAALFIWKNSFSLVPASAGRRDENLITGRDSAAGFVSLLRRNIPADKILEACAAEWKKTFGRTARYSAPEKEALEAMMREEDGRAKRERNPVETYRKISAALHRRPKPHA